MSESELSEFFSALSHPIRIRILKSLLSGDKFVSELVETYVKNFPNPPYAKKFVKLRKLLIKFYLPKLELEIEEVG